MLLQSLLRPVLTPIMRGIFDPAQSVAAAWSPLSLWPDGILSPGMWISPRTLTSEWQDYTGTTPVTTPGTVADSANPAGLALDIRAGAPEVLGPELVVNGDFSDGTTGWTPDIEQGLDTVLTADTSIFPSGGMKLSAPMYPAGGQTISGLTVGTLYEVNASIYSDSLRATIIIGNNYAYTSVSQVNEVNELSLRFVAAATSVVVWVAKVIPIVGWSSGDLYVSNISVKEVPGNHMLQSTSAARPLMSAYDGQTLGPGDTYSSTGYPIFQKYDGVDDGMATAAFTAGTLTSAMDCMIPVRRDSAALPQVIGLYQSDQTKYFGVVGTVSSDGAATYSGCGTPTVFVDGVEVASTRGALFDVLTIGDFHILEYRGLDLSAWVNANFGNYGVPYQVNGARGDIMLFESTASTADKDAARQYLADYYGVTLP